MVIDFHAHAFPDKIADKITSQITDDIGLQAVGPATSSGLLSHMAKSGVSKSVVLGVSAIPNLVSKTNTWIKSLTGGSLVPFATLHPGLDDILTEVINIKKAGFKGIKLHPLIQNFSPCDRRLYPAYEEIGEDLVILFHAGGGTRDKGNTSTPSEFKKVLTNFPALRVVIAHLGGLAMEGPTILSEIEEHLIRFDNAFLDTSHPPGLELLGPDVFVKIAEKFGAGRLVFGSDYPFSDPGKEIEFIHNLSLKDREKEMILELNALELLR